MSHLKTILFAIPLIFLGLGPLVFAQEAAFSPKLFDGSELESSISAATSSVLQDGDKKCPPRLPEPSVVSFPFVEEADKDELDKNKEVTDIGTEIVNKLFFSTPDTLFDFLKLVYGNVDKVLEKYRSEKNLDDRAVFIVYKGGNVLRMVANRIFRLVPEDAKSLLKDFYEGYFQRSDNDFSIYIDEKRLGKLQFDNVYDEINELVYEELNHIRDTLVANPKKYFAFFRLTPGEASRELKEYFSKLNTLEAVKDSSNSKWFKAQFTQLQLLGNRAVPSIECDYGGGQYDYKFEIKGQKIIGTPLSEKPNWIVNSDNQTIEFPWGSDSSKGAKFSLLRSKVAFEYFINKDGKLQRRIVPAELADLTVVHRDDDNVREFLDHYAQNVSEYNIYSKSLDETLKIQAYSLAYLSNDLRSILFDTYDRPWNIGPKYAKRINRLFFLSATEMMGAYGIGSPRIAKYNDYVKTNLIEPMKTFYSLNKNDKKILAQKIVKNAVVLSRLFRSAVQTNEFWVQLADLVKNRLLDSFEDGDEEGLDGLLDTILKNMDITYKLATMPAKRIDMRGIYNINIYDLF